ncbi:hypothetical protein WEI85_17665 [Actinomycetes bacterium KLBMP 9797]
MRGKLWFIGGLAAGFVLGARAGREKYEELVRNARKVMDHPTVQEAAGVAQAQANRLYAEGKDKLAHTKVGEKLTSTTSTTGTTGTMGTASTRTDEEKLARTTTSPSGTSSGPNTNATTL